MWGTFFLLGSFFLFVASLSGLVNDAFLVEWEFFSACGFSFSFSVLLDFLSVLFSFVVCFVSGCVFLFSVSYMGGDKFVGLFSFLVVGFVVSMNILIFVPYLVFVLVGWDLLGIISFLLVVYYHNGSSVGAGMLTVLMNRIGDVFLVLSVGFSSSFGSWSLLWVDLFSDWALIIAVLVVGASLTKSAQLPFSAWLPAAMAAPTPVSALVHSSTLVTVGVYFLFRYYSFLAGIDGFVAVVSKVGCLTLLMASLGACYEIDVKKLVALSTLSHLGFMVYVLGLGYPVLSMFHLFTHALFKSLLFLCAGHYMHMMSCSQDIRQMSGVGWKSSPLQISCTLVGFNSLCGVPFLGGFYSKDVILEGSLMSCGGFVEVVCLVVSAGISSFYSMKVLLLSIFGSFGGFSLSQYGLDSKLVSVSTVLLAIGSVVSGHVIQEILVDSCQVFNVGFEAKVFLFVLLNMGGFAVLIFGGFVFGGGGGYTLFKVFFSSLWFLRWLVYGVSDFWFKYSSSVVGSLEVGWMEVVGGQGLSGGLAKVSAVVWVLECVSVLTVLRFLGVFLLALILLFL